MRSSSGGFRGAVDESKKSRRSVVDDDTRLPLKQSDMGNKRSSDVLAGGGGAAATVPKRQSNRITLPSPLALKTSSTNGRGRRRECGEMEIGKEMERVQNYGPRSGESEAGDGASNGGSLEEDGCVHHSPPGATTTASLSSQKRIRLKGKFTENYDPVVPTLVPRKLRSGMRRPATNKLRHQSVSPELSGSKKKRNLASNGLHPLLIAGCVGNFDQTMLIQPTKTEMEVIEALYELGRTPVSEPVEEDKIGSEEIFPAKDVCVSLPKEATEEEKNSVPSPGTEARGAKEDDTKILVASSSDETTDPTFSVEQPSEQPAVAAHSVSGQTVAIPRSQIIDLESNELADSHPFHDLKPSDGVFHQSYSGNGVLQQPKPEVLPTLKSNIKLSPSSYMPEEQKQPYGKQRPRSPAIVCREEITTDLQHGSNQGHCSVTAKAEVRPYSGAGACWANSTGKVQLAEKFPSVPADKKRLLKRCTTHVYLSYAIQSHKKIEKKHPGSNDKLKVKEGKNPGVQASNLTIGSRNGVHIIKPAENNGHPVEKNMHENRIKMFQDRRFLQSQQTPMLAGAYAQQKKASDYLPLSGTGQSSNSASGLKSAGQLHVPYLPSQMLHHSSAPFPFSHGPSPYSEKPASAATDQVMFQLPSYLTNSMCGQQMVRAGGSAKQQQQMWQAQAATYYRPPQGFPKWPIDTSSLLTSAQPPPIFPPPSSHMLGRAYRPSNQPQHPQLIPRPSISSSSTTKQHQPHDGDGGSAPEAPVELQLFSKTKC